MIIKKYGDIVRFQCRACGCIFCEAARKTGIDTYQVWDADREEHGTRMDCPECGETVMGYRRGDLNGNDDHGDQGTPGDADHGGPDNEFAGPGADGCDAGDSGKAGKE